MIRAAVIALLALGADVFFVLRGERGSDGVMGAAGVTGPTGANGVAANATCLAPEFLRGVQANGSAACARASGGLSAPVLRAVSVRPFDFAPLSNATTGDTRVAWYRDHTSAQRTLAAQAEKMEAPLHLPDGATIVDASCSLKDDSAQNVTIDIVARTASGRSTCATATTSGANAAPAVLPLTGCALTAANRFDGAYTVFSLVLSGTSDTAGAWQVYACEVRYSITSSLP